MLLGTRYGASAGGSLDGTAPSGSISTGTSGTCTWVGETMEILGKKLRHSLPLSLKDKAHIEAHIEARKLPDWTPRKQKGLVDL